MMQLWPIYILVWSFCGLSDRVEAMDASVELSQASTELQVAMVCNKNGKYHNQYMDTAGQWVTDLEHKVGCLKNMDDILDYCKTIYPHHEITNIVESTHTYVIDDWCRIGNGKCKQSFLVRPFRCLEGKFQSDALLVPEPCQFDHIHNSTLCNGFFAWNMSAAEACAKKYMSLRSFAMLLPCGTDVFTGVEFVCCPLATTTHTPKFGKKSKQNKLIKTTTKVNNLETKHDPYFTRFDPRKEHDAFRAAEHRLDAKHHQKITDIMKEWSILEEKYQKMKLKNPSKAETFKLKMTDRFQKMLAALKEESSSEKHQMVALHQQRIIAQINEQKKYGMTCLVKALNARPPVMQDVEKCLTHLLKALYKDRHHTISHFNHLMTSNPQEAHREQSATINHLHDISRMVNESLGMLDRYPAFRSDMLPEMEHLINQLQIRDTLPVELSEHSVTTNGFVSVDQEAKAHILSSEKKAKLQKLAVHDAMREEHLNEVEPIPFDDVINDTENRIEIDVEVDHHAMADQVVEPRVAHVHSQKHSFNQATFLQHAASSYDFTQNVLVVGAIVSLALVSVLVVGIFLRRQNHSPTKRGFIEVDQAVSPEDRHITQMRVNGYENPTYRYFETK